MREATRQDRADTLLALFTMLVAAQDMVDIIPDMLGGASAWDSKRLHECVLAIITAHEIILDIAHAVIGDEKDSKITWKDLTGGDE